MNSSKIIALIAILGMICISCEDPKEEDVIPPTVAITSPQNNSTVQEVVSVACISTDNDRVEKVELWIDGIYSGIYDESEPYSLDWNTTSYDDKAYSISARAFDASGNYQDSDSISVTVNNLAPSNVVLNPIMYSDGTFNISWNQNQDADFLSYSLYEASNEQMNDKELIFSTNSRSDTTFSKPLGEGEVWYYQLTVSDINHLQANSSIEMGNSFLIFSSTFGGESSDGGNEVKQTTDGGLIIIGTTQSFGNGFCDVSLIKCDSHGNEEWSQTFGGTEYDEGRSIQQTSDGGFIIAGITGSFGGGGYDVWLVKTDAMGNEEWSRTFGNDGRDVGNAVQQTSDGGYIIVGETQRVGTGGCWLIKTNPEGIEEWSYTYNSGMNGDDGGNAVQQTSDGGYIITGFKGFHDDSGRVWLIKTNSTGIVEWSSEFGGSHNDYGTSVRQTSDGGYIIAGSQSSQNNHRYDIWLIKTNSEGDEEWNQIFYVAQHDYGHEVQQTADNGYIVVGVTLSYGYDTKEDALLIKFDSEGVKEWDRAFGGSEFDAGNSVIQASDGGYVIAGITQSFGIGSHDVWLFKTDPWGNTTLNIQIQ